MKRYIYLRLFILTLLNIVSLSNNGYAQFFSGGVGTLEDPYKIATAVDIDNIRYWTGAKNTNVHFRLMNDIDLTDFLKNMSDGWIPIGNMTWYDECASFNGYFHGGGHKISGLWINNLGFDYVGLFGHNMGVIDSLAITGTNIKGGTKYIGGLVGCNSGTISNVSCSIDIFSSKYIKKDVLSGGLIGYNKGIVTECFTAGSVCDSITNTLYSSLSVYAGGIIGYNEAGVIMSSYSIGNVSVLPSNKYTQCSYSTCSGGLIGQNNSGVISMCYATGDIMAASGNNTGYALYASAGGLIGDNSGGIVSNCYATGNVSSSNKSVNPSSYSGGLIGSFYLTEELSNCYSTGQISGYKAGGCIGYISLGAAKNIYNCYSLRSPVIGSTNGTYGIESLDDWRMKRKEYFVNWDFESVWGIKVGYSFPDLRSAPLFIIGETSIQNNSTHIYTTNTGLSNYVWTIENGMIISGQSSNEIIVKWDSDANEGILNISSEIRKSSIKVRLFKSTAIEDALKFQISVFPNPTTGILNVRNTLNTIPKIVVYDLYGRQLLQTTQNQIDLSSFANGIYLIQIEKDIVKVEKR